MRRRLYSTVAILVSLVAVVVAQETTRKSTAPGRSRAVDRKTTTPTRTPQSERLNRAQLYATQRRQVDSLITRKRTEGEKEIAELRRILELAQSEKATKTTAALQSLIDRKQKELDDEIRSYEARQKRMEEQLRTQTERVRSQPAKRSRVEKAQKDGANASASRQRGTATDSGKKTD